VVLCDTLNMICNVPLQNPLFLKVFSICSFSLYGLWTDSPFFCLIFFNFLFDWTSANRGFSGPLVFPFLVEPVSLPCFRYRKRPFLSPPLTLSHLIFLPENPGSLQFPDSLEAFRFSSLPLPPLPLFFEFSMSVSNDFPFFISTPLLH